MTYRSSGAGGLALAALVLAAGAGPARAQLISSEGDRYAETTNANGIVLTSEHPKYRIVGQGPQARVVSRPEVFYLGRSCDAYNEHFGDGRWSLSDAGVFVEFVEGATISFRFGLRTQDPRLTDCPL